MQLEKHCVTVDILLHWFYRMIGIIYYTNVFFFGIGVCTCVCGPMSQQRMYDKDSSLLNA